MSTSDITVWAAVVASSAILLLVAIDYRKPARRRRITPRGGPLPGRAPMVQVVEQRPVRRYQRTPWWRRLLALGGLGVMGVVIGAVLAVITAGILVGSFVLIDHVVK